MQETGDSNARKYIKVVIDAGDERFPVFVECDKWDAIDGMLCASRDGRGAFLADMRNVLYVVEVVGNQGGEECC